MFRCLIPHTCLKLYTAADFQMSESSSAETIKLGHSLHHSRLLLPTIFKHNNNRRAKITFGRLVSHYTSTSLAYTSTPESVVHRNKILTVNHFGRVSSFVDKIRALYPPLFPSSTDVFFILVNKADGGPKNFYLAIAAVLNVRKGNRTKKPKFPLQDQRFAL